MYVIFEIAYATWKIRTQLKSAVPHIIKVLYVSSAKAISTGIPVSGPLPASIITPYAISATQFVRMRTMVDSC